VKKFMLASVSQCCSYKLSISGIRHPSYPLVASSLWLSWSAIRT
jgi:hypothetical protein